MAKDIEKFYPEARHSPRIHVARSGKALTLRATSKYMMPLDKRRLEDFIRTLPEAKVGRTDHYDSRENSVYLRPENKKLEEALWHELAHAYLHQNFRWERFLIFSTGFFIIFTASGILFFAFLTLFSRSIWIIDFIFTAVCLTLMLVEEKLVNYYGKLLKKEARREILSKIRKAPSLRL